MLTARVIRPFRSHGKTIPSGATIRIADDVLPQLNGLVEVVPSLVSISVPRHRPDPCGQTPRAWLQDGELRVTGVFDDLAAEIVRLTGDDLDQQRRLLVEHCQQYDDVHLPGLIEAWEERVAIMEYDGGLSRQEAEDGAAKDYHLTAWLPILRRENLTPQGEPHGLSRP